MLRTGPESDLESEHPGPCHSEGLDPHYRQLGTSQTESLLPGKNKAQQFLVFFFLHFIISNQVNNSIKREKSKEVFNAEGPNLGGGQEGQDPSAGSNGS